MGKFNKVELKKIDEIVNRLPIVPPFENDTVEKQRLRKAAVMKRDWRGFSKYCQLYLGVILGKEFNGDHKEMFEYVEREDGKLTVITGYRGLGKTTLMAICYVLWLLCTGQVSYVIQVAAIDSKAKKRTKLIYNQLMHNTRILNDFPKCRPVEGNEDSFYLGNKALVEACTIDRDIKGDQNPLTARRPNLIIYDDIDRKKNKGNRKIGKERKDQIKGDGMGALEPGNGRVIVLGNETHVNYAISQFAEELDPANKTGHIIKGNQVFLRYPVEDKNGNSRWAEQYSNEDLQALRIEMGLSTYLREMMGRKVIEGVYFKYDWFKFWEVLPKRFSGMWLYADPSWGAKGDYKAIVGIGYDEESGKYYMTELWAAQCSNNLFYEQFVKTYYRLRRYGCKLAFEVNYGQQRHLKEMDGYCEKAGLPRISHLIKRINNKESKSSRIEALDTVIESGSLLFIRNEYTETLMSQFLDYPDGYDDVPDAVAGAMERFTTYSRKKRGRIKQLRY